MGEAGGEEMLARELEEAGVGERWAACPKLICNRFIVLSVMGS